MTRTVPTIGEPWTNAEIRAELERLHHASTAYWQTFSDLEFLAPLGDAWSPADNVRHLTKSNRPVARALGMARPLLFVLFGPARRSSRSLPEVRETYHGLLAGGGQAGRFAPSPLPAPSDPKAARATIMARRDEAATELLAAIAPWSEKALDRYRLPHPLLGKLTVREMLLFTLYHNLHHVLGVERRLTA